MVSRMATKKHPEWVALKISLPSDMVLAIKGEALRRELEVGEVVHEALKRPEVVFTKRSEGT